MSPKIESLRVRVLRRKHLLKVIIIEEKKRNQLKDGYGIVQTVQESKSTVDLKILGSDMMPTYDELLVKPNDSK